MTRLRIVTDAFDASTYGQGPTEHRRFKVQDALVFLRNETGATFFARIEDIPAEQPVPPERLPEYIVNTATFDRSTRPAQ